MTALESEAATITVIPPTPSVLVGNTATVGRARVLGKFIAFGEQKVYVKGVTYGPFRPDAGGHTVGTIEQVRCDFSRMIGAGINCVRLYAPPPRWVLDVAEGLGLKVMVGVPWVQNVAFFDSRELLADCVRRIGEATSVCRDHPALFGYAIGNEIPSSVVRWYGHRRIERHIAELFDRTKQADPEALVTYVNYPSTEYLELPFLDFACFNVYLEQKERLDSYMARLQNIACDRPLVMGELGLDCLRHGEEEQARSLALQIRATFAAGAAGMFIFSWTDEWFKENHDIHDWKFGLTDAARIPRLALDEVSAAFGEVPCLAPRELPPASVVVCTYNGGRTIRRCLEALSRLEYPHLEVIVVDDGSKDDAAAIAAEYPFRLIRTQNQGLSAARNRGLQEATGEVIAYTDDDAYPDPHWLQYLVRSLVESSHVGMGGPNLPVAGDGATAACVANSPGGPTHVLLSDTLAEHIPGCNMAFWRKNLLAIGGFDTQFRIAGDDVDICWRLQAAGGTLGFSPAAMVWHHRRNTVRGFWRQQVNYGRAEADLERKWPEKYNVVGHPTWAGRIYGGSAVQALFKDRRRVYHGVWGSALFQHVYHTPMNLWWALPTMPEWYALIGLLTAAACLGLVFKPLLLVVPLLIGMMLFAGIQAGVHAGRSRYVHRHRSAWELARMRLLTAILFRLQPLARLVGRMHYGLTPWRLRGVRGFSWPGPKEILLWCKVWRWPAERLGDLEHRLVEQGGVVLRGTPYVRWDLEIRGGLVGAVRIRQLTEDLAHGAQLVRLKARPRVSFAGIFLYVCLVAIGVAAIFEELPYLAGAVGMLGFGLVVLAVRETAAAMATVIRTAHLTEEK